MTFRESFFQVKQLLVTKLQRLGISAANMNLGWTSLLNLKVTSNLSISVPLSLVYSDNFNISGVLSNTANNGVISGATVKLKVGDTIVDTTTTNTNGEYSFTRTPVHRGTHSFQVIFDGDNTFEASTSTVVTREIGKETSVLTALASSQYVSIGDSITINGTLTDDEGSILAGETISLLIEDIVEDTTTTDSNGEYSFTFAYPDNSIHTFKTTYSGDGNYTASECNVNIVLMIASSITVANTDDIVSLHGSVNSTTLTATVYDQNLNGLEGLSVAWYVDDVLVDTTVTDSNGEATYTYEAVNAGDVSVRAVCMSLSETCIIHDITILDIYSLSNYFMHGDSYGTGSLTNPTATSIQYNSRIWAQTKTDITNCSNYQIDFDLTKTQNRCGLYFCMSKITQDSEAVIPTYTDFIQFWCDVRETLIYKYENEVSTLLATLAQDVMGYSGTAHFTVKRENDSLSIFKENVLLIDNIDVAGFENGFGVWKWNDGYANISNWQITPL